MKEDPAIPFSIPDRNCIRFERRHCRLMIWLVCLTLALPIAGMAQTNVPTPLPPAAQEAFDKGIIAAKEGGYIVAIRYLQDARKIAPQAPQIFRSLGAVEAKIPGRELRAIAWYGAYLAAFPNAPDAADVKKEIVRLEVKSQINISGLIKSVQDAANQLSGDKDIDLRSVAEMWAKAGDTATALETADLIENKSYAYGDIAIAQAESGDIAGALKTADLIKHAFVKSRAQTAIAEAQVRAGDIAGARKTIVEALKTADLIQDAYDKSRAQEAIAEAQAESGDIAGAQKTTDLIQEVFYKRYGQMDIAKAQIKAGDIAGAKITLVSALKTADLIQGAHFKSTAQSAIAEAQASSGDIAGARKTIVEAQKTADLIQDAYFKSTAQSAIAEAQAKSGDIAGAQKTVELIQDSYWKNRAQRAIAEIQAKAGVANAPAPHPTRQSAPDAQPPIQPVLTASDWLKMLDDDLNTKHFLDLDGYLKSLPPSDDPQNVFDSLHKTAKKVVSAQHVISGMLKQQARQ